MIILFALLLSAQAEEDLVELWTVARSPDIAAAWGHTLLRIRHDDVDLVYNYGRFQRTPTFVLDYLTNDLVYWLATERPESARKRYESRGRGVVAQTLHMPADRLDRLVAALKEEARPENREFDYDPVDANCTIRTRDALDTHVFDGALKAAATRAADQPTYRALSQRLLAEEPLTRWVAHAMWGTRIDRPLTRWDAWGMPDQLHDGFEAIALGTLPIDAPDGVRVDRPRFTGSIRAALRPDGADAGFAWMAGALGLWGVLFAWPAARPSRLSHVALGLGTTLWTLVAGVAGLALALLVFQGPPAADGNAVLLTMHPLLFALPVVTWLAPRQSWARWTLRAFLALPVLGWLLALITGQSLLPWAVPAILVQGALVAWAEGRAASATA